MKPDPKRHKDKARLDAKKAQGKAFRDAKKEARAARADPTTSAAWASLIDAARLQRGDSRARAVADLIELARPQALTALRELIDNATGKNQRELARLWLKHGGDGAVDDALDGQLGEVVVAEDAPHLLAEAVNAAQRRLLAPTSPSPGAVTALLARLGPLTLPGVSDAARASLLHALLAAHVAQPLPAALVDELFDRCLAAAPRVAWAYRHSLPDDPRSTLAAIASENGADVDEDRVRLLAQWLQGLPPDVRGRRLAQTGLPRTSRTLRTSVIAPLLRLMALYDDDIGRRRDCLYALWTHDAVAARETILVVPEVAPDVTAHALASVDDDEVIEVLRPHLASSAGLRDALFRRAAGRRAVIADDAVGWLDVDAVAVGAFLSVSEAPHAAETLVAIVEREPGAVAVAVAVGALAYGELGDRRRAALKPERAIADGQGGDDVVVGLATLRALSRRADDRAVAPIAQAVDATIADILRRYAPA